LRDKFAPGGFLHFGQGKWYPRTLPRWAFSCYWRTDGLPLWHYPEWVAEPIATTVSAQLRPTIRARIRAGHRSIKDYRSPLTNLAYLLKERELPVMWIQRTTNRQPEERERLRRVFERSGSRVCRHFSGYGNGPEWQTALWMRSRHLFLSQAILGASASAAQPAMEPAGQIRQVWVVDPMARLLRYRFQYVAATRKQGQPASPTEPVVRTA
jgi:hypothetical protein